MWSETSPSLRCSILYGVGNASFYLFMGSETLPSACDQEYIHFMGSETLPSACSYGVGNASFCLLQLYGVGNASFCLLHSSDKSSIPFYSTSRRKRFLLPVTYFQTNLVYPFTLRVTKSSIPFYSTSNGV